MNAERGLCIETIINTHVPSAFSIGNTVPPIELRYLGLDIFVDNKLCLPQIEQFIVKEYNELARANMLQALSPEILDLRMRNAIGAQETIIRDIVDEAEKLGIFQDISIDDLMAMLQNKTIDREYLFELSNWCILNNESGVPFLIWKDLDDSIRTANLDEIHSIDPQFLPTKLEEYHLHGAIRSLLRDINYKLKFHELDESKLPSFLNMFSSEQVAFAKEIASLFTLFATVYSCGTDQEKSIQKFIRKLFDTQFKINETTIFLQYYINHIAECEAITPLNQEKYTNLSNFLNLMIIFYGKIRSGVPGNELIRDNNLDSHIMHSPHSYTNMANALEESTSRDERSEDERIVDLVTLAQSVVDLNTFLNDVESSFPDLHQKLIAFQESLGVDDIRSESKFDQLIAMITDHYIYMHSIIRREEVIFKDVIKLIFDESGRITGSDLRDDIDGNISITDKELQALLFIYSVKKIQEEIHQMSRRSDDAHKLASSIVSELQQLIRDKQSSSQDKSEKILRVNNKRAEMINFIEANGISEEKLDAIEEVATTKVDGENEKLNPQIFDIAFNILYLASKKLIDPHSKVLQAIIKEIFPNFPEQIWDVINS